MAAFELPPNLSLYTYKSNLISITDGDSLWAELSRGHGDYSIKNIRLARIDAWEKYGVEKLEGLKAKAYLETLIAQGDRIIIQTLGLDNFGRTISEVWFRENSSWLTYSPSDRALDPKSCGKS